MALKRRNKVEASFSMSSMTDVIFLLLIFFMVTSTVVFPNAIKILLPQSKKQTSASPMTRVTIDKELNYYVACGNPRDMMGCVEQSLPLLIGCQKKESERYVALYANESVPYKEVVKILNIANQNNFKMVIATRPVN